MCNLTAPPPHHPASQRHKCGTSAAPKRSRTAKSAPPQRTKVSIIRYLCVPNCGTFLGAGTTSPRLCPFFAIRTAPNCSIHLKNLVILTTWLMHSFLIPNLHLGLPFSLSGPARRPFPFPKVQLRNQKSSWCVVAPHWAYSIAEGGRRGAFPPYGSPGFPGQPQIAKGNPGLPAGVGVGRLPT
jgi:hypothetical protein